MKTGKTIICLLALVILVSCSRKEEAQKGPADIVHDYTKTLTTAPEKARGAEHQADERGEKMDKAMEELDK